MDDNVFFVRVQDIEILPQLKPKYESERAWFEKTAKTLRIVFKSSVDRCRPMKVVELDQGRYGLVEGFLAYTGCTMWDVAEYPCVNVKAAAGHCVVNELFDEVTSGSNLGH